jgi:hypothetical protein
MKKILIVAILILCLGAIWFGEKRKFFLIGTEYVTLWKTYNNVSYLIPGKYFGLTKPSSGYIRTSNTNNLTLYISEKIPRTIIFKNEDSVEVNTSSNKSDIVFEKYMNNPEKFHAILFNPGGHTYKDLSTDAHVLDIIIKENYAMNEAGQKQ